MKTTSTIRLSLALGVAALVAGCFPPVDLASDGGDTNSSTASVTTPDPGDTGSAPSETDTGSQADTGTATQPPTDTGTGTGTADTGTGADTGTQPDTADTGTSTADTGTGDSGSETDTGSASGDTSAQTDTGTDSGGSCAGMACFDPPASACASPEAIDVANPQGYCVNYHCEYARREERCEKGGCGSGVCTGNPCQGVTCAASPAAECVDSATLRVYAAEGMCKVKAGQPECRYQSSTLACAGGCADGRCVDDVCLGQTCDAPPARYCESDSLLVFDVIGRCDASQCLHASQAVDCGLGGCAEGKCADDDACEHVTCDRPPARYCLDSATLRAFASRGACDGGACDYQSVEVSCPDGCVDGACVGDPCRGVSCDSPPAAACVDGDTLRHWDSAPGVCSDGVCQYQTVETVCADGCAAGECVDDPCVGRICALPPASYCAGNAVVAYQPVGICDFEGLCSYDVVSETCALGCALGACLPEDTDTDTGADTGTATATADTGDTGTITAADTGTGDTGTGTADTGTGTATTDSGDTGSATTDTGTGDTGTGTGSDTGSDTGTGTGSDTGTDTDTDTAPYCDSHSCWLVEPTNQTECYDDGVLMECSSFPCSDDGSPDYCGQDAQYPDNDRTFACYNAAGGLQSPCDATADEGETVVDSLTGFEWQRTWVAGKSWQGALDYCAALSYGGHTDWRLPSADELAVLVDYGRNNPAIDTVAFPATPADWFWSSSPQVGGTDAWWVSFDDGAVYNGGTSSGGRARCVRGGPYRGTSADRFQVSGLAGQEVVFDRATGLSWQKTVGGGKTWKEALAYCEGSTYGGQDDWRLPDVNELRSLVNLEKSSPASDFPDMPSHWTWPSSSFVGNPVTAWMVYFGGGHVGSGGDKALGYDARCVRSALCGNGTVDAGEECDGTDFGAETCETLGWSPGELHCDEWCQIDDSVCPGVRTFAGDGTKGFKNGALLEAQFNVPRGLGVSPTGQVYVADSTNQRIRLIDGGQVTTFAGTGTRANLDGPVASAQFGEPWNVAFNATGSVMYVPGDLHAVRSISGGQVTTIAYSGLSDSPRGVAVDASGAIFIADSRGHRIMKIVSGTPQVYAGTGSAGFAEGALLSAKFNWPEAIAFGPDGKLYVSDGNNHRIRVIGGGTVSTFAGTGEGAFLDGPALSAKFNFPAGLDFDADGRVFVADYYNQRIRMIADGQVTSVAGGGGGHGFADGPLGTARFSEPNDVAVYGDKLLVADTSNNRIRIITPAP